MHSLTINIINSDLPGLREAPELRYQRCAETLQILRQAWTQERIVHQGELYRFDMPADPAMGTGNAKASFSRSTAVRASARSRIRFSTTANSSPPSLATTSVGRTLSANRCPIVIKSWSPAACPSRSLTGLKSSRSIKSTAVSSLYRRVAASAVSR